MRARLAFAISMVIEFDCFLIDEIIAVGDARFHQKCHLELFEKRGDRAMIIVSHDAGYIREHCTRAAVLSGGELHHAPTLDEAFDFYHRETAVAA
jgi:capsular polysaccharide transport system ATP-binding protein